MANGNDSHKSMIGMSMVLMACSMVHSSYNINRTSSAGC